MDKNAIKKYAVWARRELIARVSQKAAQYGITEKDTGDIRDESVNGRLLTEVERDQRAALIYRIHQEGFQQVMEEVAYTWFNRFIALRFMEVNNYLPTRIRVFTDEANAFKPQILDEAIHMELDGLDMERVYTYKEKNQTEELYKYLLITQCNALNSILPGMFQQIADYTELLLPDNLLREGSVIEQMIALIPEEDWQDQVQIIGWLYQYYNAEPKDQVFANLKKNIKIGKNDIPAATQLFTPDWIVRYMVENSLGRLWVEGHPDDGLKAGWKYYLEEAEQEPEVQAQLAKLRAEYAVLKPEDIRCIDPCMGSGHILVYMFDVLMQIYDAYGYSTREAVQSILENNLYGLDIDDRAAQLAYFAVMMKARQYDRRFFTRGIQPHVYTVPESQYIPDRVLSVYGDEADIARRLQENFQFGKDFGSLLGTDLTPDELSKLKHRMLTMYAFDPTRMTLDELGDALEANDRLEPLINVTELLVQKYDIIVTNPPYMSTSNLIPEMVRVLKEVYPDSKSDLFAVFIERCGEMLKPHGYQAMITQHAWMFLSSFEKLRAKLLNVDTVNMAHLGARAFEEIGGEVVQTTSFVLRRNHTQGYKGTYTRLIEPTTQQGKEDMFLAGKNRYVAQQDNFTKIPGAPVAYWVSEPMRNCFATFPLLGDEYTLLAGTSTGDNEQYQRFWAEVDYNRISRRALQGETKRWYPCNTGGIYRKYSLNDDYIIDWENDGYRIRHHINSKGKIGSAVRNREYFFRAGLTWNKLSTSNFGVRAVPAGYISDDTARMIVCDENDLAALLGFLCSNVCMYFLKILSPTMSFTNSELQRLPISFGSDKEIIKQLSTQNLKISVYDRDSFETSWDFKKHPLIQHRMLCGWGDDVSEYTGHISGSFEQWKIVTERRFTQLKANEEELNRIFIDIYGLQDELTPEVEDKDVTVRRADLGHDIRSFISYAVGCMFGRYSLDVEGLVYAGGNFDAKYCRWIQQCGDQANEEIDENGRLIHGGWAGCSMWAYDGVRKDGKWVAASYPPDTDNIIPITDDEYFDDDIVGRFVQFVETVYGRGTLEENLKFIADALGGTGTPRQVIRSYFLNDFYADHLKIYQKRPIYWLFDSGKKNGFKCLIYMHRYAPDTIARIRTDYVHEQQSRYRTAIEDLEKRVASAATTAERVKLTKQLTKIKAQAEELRLYEEKIHHLADQMLPIDLDDGVKVNYAKFADVLAKIK